MDGLVEAVIEGVGEMAVCASFSGSGKNNPWGCLVVLFLVIAVVVGAFYYL